MGEPFFSNRPRFPVPDNNIIPSLEFLTASEGIVDFISLLGNVFIPVKNDVNGNVEKLKKIYRSDITKYATINSIILSELDKPPKEKIATDALLWLKRALEYLKQFLLLFFNDYSQNIKKEDLTDYFNEAYTITLKKHHNWIAQKLFGLCIKATPSRSSLLSLLTNLPNQTIDDATEKKLFNDLKDYLEPMTKVIESIHVLFDKHGIIY